MFIYNFKMNKKILSIFFIITSLIVILSILFFSIYIIFIKNPSKADSCIKSDNIFDIDEKNYANILQASNENIEPYIGKKVHIIGYVYRLLNFNKNQFVIARDMKFSNNSNSLVIGFLCEYKKASDFPDGAWVEVVGKIKKGDFNGDIAMLDIISIKETSRPEVLLVDPPNNTYIPTSNIF